MMSEQLKHLQKAYFIIELKEFKHASFLFLLINCLTQFSVTQCANHA